MSALACRLASSQLLWHAWHSGTRRHGTLFRSSDFCPHADRPRSKALDSLIFGDSVVSGVDPEAALGQCEAHFYASLTAVFHVIVPQNPDRLVNAEQLAGVYFLVKTSVQIEGVGRVQKSALQQTGHHISQIMHLVDYFRAIYLKCFATTKY
ncbi:hypothetical protein BpHYR1_033295 [Brachionus plicatilis]|uniref:Uncharacterized protein n=1 Tax=Brachionus plicatilis TaxID=10195 RepID=A0A3M7S6Y6_BRAPC|nr:hypothetical protein BpHYR1_033295 [Brachionus plicatilis]